MAAPSDATKNEIMVLNYTAKDRINFEQYSSNNLHHRIIFLLGLNISHEDVIQMFREKLTLQIIDDKQTINDKNASKLNRIFHLAMLACNVMSDSVKSSKQLKARNTILQTKCENYDQVVEERNRLKSEKDEIITNLCLALGRNVNDKENVVHLTNICAALFARQSENQYILIENDKAKYVMNKQLTNIRVKTLLFYDAILNSLDKFKDELLIKNLKISQLMDDVNTIKAENEKKNCIIQLLREQHSEPNHELLDTKSNGVNKNDELYEGKRLIAEQINQLEENNNIDANNYELADLISIFIRSIFSKEEHLEAINKHLTQSMRDQNQQLIKEIDDHKKWQKHLENENERLFAEIEYYKRTQKQLIRRENEYSELKKDFSKIQCMYDELLRENARQKTILVEHQRELSRKNTKCIDGDNLIKILQSNLMEETDKLKTVNSMYINEKKKCQKVENQAQRMIEEITVQIDEKNRNIASIQGECTALKQHINSTGAEVDNLKRNIITLTYALSEKNRTIRNMSKTATQQQQYTKTQFRDLMHTLSTLEQQMDLVLNDLCSCKKKIGKYESVLNDMQNTIQQQLKARNNWISEHKHTKGGKQQLPEKIVVNSLKHQTETEHSGNICDVSSTCLNGMTPKNCFEFLFCLLFLYTYL